MSSLVGRVLSPGDDSEVLRRLTRWHLADSRDPPEDVFQDRPELVEPLRRRMDRLRQVSAALDVLDDAEAMEKTPASVGLYRIVRRVGEGANGVVYEAIHSVTSKRVALKLLVGLRHASDHARRRFAREAELASQLDHPNTATVFDAGDVDGVPFLAMAFIDGEPLSRDERGAGSSRSSSSQETVALFIQACRGVEHAHAKGLIHRDLKPTNILVGRNGRPVIVDFGLAKQANETTSSLSLDAPVRGTVAFASPEQCRDESGDVRSDIYSLGVVLFGLLVPNAHPHNLDGTEWQVRQRIASNDARLLRHVDRRIDRDLDAVVAKALEREPNRRYATTSALIDDLDRWLNGRPVQARPASLGYVARKWIGRHRGRVAVIATVALLIVTVAAAASWRVVRERDRARAAAETAEAVNTFLEDLLSAADPFGGGTHDLTVAEVLAAADERVAAEFADRPLIEARLRRVIGRTLLELDRPAEAEPHLRRAVELLTRYVGPDDARTLEAQLALCRFLLATWQNDEAEPILRDVVRRSTNQLGAVHETTFDARRRLYLMLSETGQTAEAAEGLEALYNDVTLVRPESHPQFIWSLGALAIVKARTGAWEAALPVARRTLKLAELHVGPDHAGTLSWVMNVAEMEAQTGDFDEAIRLHRENVARRTGTYGENHNATWFGRQNLAQLLLLRGAPSDVEEAANILQDLRRRQPAEPNWLPTRLDADLMLVEALHTLGRDAEAESVLAENAAWAEQILTLDRPSVAWLVRWSRHLATAEDEHSRWHIAASAAVARSYGLDAPQTQRFHRTHVFE